MSEPAILMICGALRAASTNRLLLAEAKRLFGPARWSEADLRLPLYDGDLEDAEGIPSCVQRLADQIAAADGVMIATPEYNKMISGVLKNALDWVSRKKDAPWAGKPVALLSAAAGRSGGERAQSTLRLALAPFRVRIVPGPEVLIADARKAFDPEGRLLNEHATRGLEKLMADFRHEIALLSK